LAIFAVIRRAMRSAAQRLNNTAFLAAPLSNVPVVHMGQTPCKCACKMADEPATSLILFRHSGVNMLVHCGILCDVTRTPRTVVNCYELR